MSSISVCATLKVFNFLHSASQCRQTFVLGLNGLYVNARLSVKLSKNCCKLRHQRPKHIDFIGDIRE